MFLPPPAPPPPPATSPYPPPPIVLAQQFAPVGEDGTLDAVSFLGGADPVEAALLWQFTVRKGEGAALGDNGHELHKVTKASPQAPLELEDKVRSVCTKFEARGQLAGLEVTAAISDGGTARAVISATARNVIADRDAKLSTIVEVEPA